MQENDKMLNFTLPRDGGEMVSLSDYAGKKLVLFLYPKDDTPGCTLESIEFTTKLPFFEAEGAAVVGLSKNSVNDHDKFCKKHDLKVPLLSDEASDLVDRLGAWKEKSMYGKTFMGIERTTLLIDENGTIRKIWRKVKVKGHVDEVLVAVKSI